MVGRQMLEPWESQVNKWIPDYKIVDNEILSMDYQYNFIKSTIFVNGGEITQTMTNLNSITSFKVKFLCTEEEI